MSDEGGAAALVEVRIVRLSVPVFRRASEQTDELLREFALIRGETTDHVPARLLAVVDELRARFGGFSAEPAAALDAAVAEDEDEIDLVYRVPTETAQAVVELSALLDEADEFCRAGDLLTLATPPEALAFRRWFLDEFVRQIEGEPPLPWPDAIRGGGAG